MPTEDYYKARFTGTADMSKPGAADGLIARNRRASSHISAHAQSVNAQETIQAGHDLGVFISIVLPYLFVLVGGWTLFYKAGIKLNLGTSAEAFPTWYALFMIVVPLLVTVLLRKVIKGVFAGLALLWIGYAIIF